MWLVFETDPGADNLFDSVAPAEQSEAATISDDACRFPGNEYIVSIVINSDFHGMAGF
jgi:hypothetical protein